MKKTRSRNSALLGAVAVFCSPCCLAGSVLEAPAPNDIARNLVDHFQFDKLTQLRDAGLEKAQLSAQPWSGWYWPLNDGGLAYRYADPSFPEGAEWSLVFKYLISNLGKEPVNYFSPAEKYDRLVGDANYTLTRGMIQSSEDHEAGGNIQVWMGYCTGWANAAMILPRPVHSVVVTAADGKTQIEFRPSDIKALGALLWANGNSPARVTGSTCLEDPVRRDPATGRALDPKCRDTNAATFHLAVTHQIGLSQRSLLMDSDPGYQIWNQPIYSYNYHYFNPKTNQTGSLEASEVKIKDFPNDPFKTFRSSETNSLVGVEIEVTFIYETHPSTQAVDSPATDEKRVPIYRYDLELDVSGRIVGGEWHTRLHPDVLWVAPLGAHSATRGDALVVSQETWQIGRPLPPSWIQGAKLSAQYMQPLGVIVDQLFNWSSR